MRRAKRLLHICNQQLEESPSDVPFDQFGSAAEQGNCHSGKVRTSRLFLSLSKILRHLRQDAKLHRNSHSFTPQLTVPDLKLLDRLLEHITKQKTCFCFATNQQLMTTFSVQIVSAGRSIDVYAVTKGGLHHIKQQDLKNKEKCASSKLADRFSDCSFFRN